MSRRNVNQNIAGAIESLDSGLSKRFIALDPKGYFIIKLDYINHEILVEHYTNDINESGTAINPENGKAIQCKGDEKRSPNKLYKGKSAKEVGIKLSEGKEDFPISRIDHAMYLGRELQKAEECLKECVNYIQD